MALRLLRALSLLTPLLPVLWRRIRVTEGLFGDLIDFLLATNNRCPPLRMRSLQSSHLLPTIDRPIWIEATMTMTRTTTKRTDWTFVFPSFFSIECNFSFFLPPCFSFFFLFKNQRSGLLLHSDEICFRSRPGREPPIHSVAHEKDGAESKFAPFLQSLSFWAFVSKFCMAEGHPAVATRRHRHVTALILVVLFLVVFVLVLVVAVVFFL